MAVAEVNGAAASHTGGSPSSWRPGRLVVGLVVSATTLVTVAVAARRVDVLHPDWLLVRAAVPDLLSTRVLQTYRLHPQVQMGPLAIALARLPRVGYVVAVAAMLAPTLWALAFHALRALDDSSRRGRTRRLVVSGASAALLVVPWSQLAWKGHADDALVLLGCGLLLAARGGSGLPPAWQARGTTGRRRLALGVVGLLVAVAGKPTGVALAPMLATDTAGAVLAAATLLAVWGPFAVATPSSLLEASRGVMQVGQGSLPAMFGHRVGQPPPGWVRPIQLGAGLLASAVGALVRRPAAGLLLAFAARALVEPNPAPAYSIPLVVLAWTIDLELGWPVTMPFAAASFWLSQPVLDGHPGGLRIASLLLVCAVAALLLAATRARPV